jgi:hypothetical protein
MSDTKAGLFRAQDFQDEALAHKILEALQASLKAGDFDTGDHLLDALRSLHLKEPPPEPSHDFLSGPSHGGSQA